MKFLHDIQRQCFTTAVEKGWWPMVEKTNLRGNPMEIDLSQVNIPEKLALMHSEISEALEFARQPDFDPKRGIVYTGTDNKPDGFWVELGDNIVRIFDMAGAYGIDMEKVLEEKMNYNKHRPFRHGNKKF